MVRKSIPIPVVITKEKVGKKYIFVALCPVLDIASQGRSTEEAIDNLKDAINLYWQEPESRKILGYEEIFTGTIEVSVSPRIEHTKASHSIGAQGNKGAC